MSFFGTFQKEIDEENKMLDFRCMHIGSLLQDEVTNNRMIVICKDAQSIKYMWINGSDCGQCITLSLKEFLVQYISMIQKQIIIKDVEERKQLNNLVKIVKSLVWGEKNE